VDPWFEADIQNNPDTIVKRRVNEVGERIVSVYRDGDPPVNRWVIGSPLTDESR
jgi:hypothetical protein